MLLIVGDWEGVDAFWWEWQVRLGCRWMQLAALVRWRAAVRAVRSSGWIVGLWRLCSEEVSHG